MAWFYSTGDALKATERGWLKFCPGPLCAQNGSPPYPGSDVLGAWKPQAEFGVNRSRPGGRQGHCKVCVEYSRGGQK